MQGIDLRKSLAMAGDALLGILDPDNDLMPTGGYEVAHDLGRWWDAALRLEEAIQFTIPPQLEAASLRNLQRLTDNPDRLLMNRPDLPCTQEKARINPHNFRETLLAYGGLVRRRQSAWGQEVGLHLARTMGRILQSDGSLDYTQLGSWGQLPGTQDPSLANTRRGEWFDGTGSSGRALEALVWLFETTGAPEVLEVAQRIAEHHLEQTTNPDGAVREEIISPENVGHDHSYHGTLRGLLSFGLLTGQKQYVDTVEATYRQAVRHRIVHESGWAPHDLGKLRFPNEHGDPVADPASAGDSAQLALWLALRADCDDLLDDVERLVRARLLPAQLAHEDVRRHPERSFAPREIGAWCIHGLPHAGKGCTPDVAAAVTHSLCDIHLHTVTRSPLGIRVNLHFDFEDACVKVSSRRQERAKLQVVVKEPDNILLRIPSWAPEASLVLAVDGEPLPVTRVGQFAQVSRDLLKADSRIVMSHDLPTRETEELMPSGRCYRFRWHGDAIIGVTPAEGPLSFHAELPGDSADGETTSPT